MARVLITGCSTGFGRATAIELTKRGHDVVATARKPATLDDLDVAMKLPLDVDDDRSIAEAVAAAGEIDALVNNAGFGVIGPVESVPIPEIRRMLETNYFGAVRMIQAVVPQLRVRGRGTVVNISSVQGRVAAPLSGFYSASKFALEATTEALRYEVNHFGIRVVLIEPGYIETGFQGREGRYGIEVPYDELERQWEKARDVLVAGAGAGAGGSPELVAGAVADAIEADDPPLRVPVGSDADMVLSTRAALDDATFEATMRETLGLTW
jgi:NAD(P)-dependent dehydrogenase (short-subunit alcohol dehydrogenase family)